MSREILADGVEKREAWDCALVPAGRRARLIHLHR